MRAVDQFPHTSHCELVARLEPIEGWEPPAEEAKPERLAPDELDAEARAAREARLAAEREARAKRAKEGSRRAAHEQRTKPKDER